MNVKIRTLIVQTGCYISILYILSYIGCWALLSILRVIQQPLPWAVSLFLPTYFASPLALLLTLTALVLCIRMPDDANRKAPKIVLLSLGMLISGWTSFILLVMSNMGSYAI